MKFFFTMFVVSMLIILSLPKVALAERTTVDGCTIGDNVNDGGCTNPRQACRDSQSQQAGHCETNTTTSIPLCICNTYPLVGVTGNREGCLYYINNNDGHTPGACYFPDQPCTVAITNQLGHCETVPLVPNIRECACIPGPPQAQKLLQPPLVLPHQ